MYYLLGFVGEILLLLLLSKSLHKELGKFFFDVFRNEHFSAYVMAFLFLPGTLIHELSHYIAAAFLGVRTGKFSIYPKIHSETVVLGSVEVAKSDPFRRFLIGTAPFVVGILLLLGITYTILSYNLVTQWYIAVGFIYCLFTISNTMFSSRRDMEGALELTLAIVIVVAIGYLLGIRMIFLDIERYTPLIQQADMYVGITLAIDVVSLILLKTINRHFFRAR